MPPEQDRRYAFSTPLVWAGGGVLLTLSLWLPGMVAFFRTLAGLFR